MSGKGRPLLVGRDVDGARSLALKLQGEVRLCTLCRSDHDLAGRQNFAVGAVGCGGGAGARKIGIIDEEPDDAGAIGGAVAEQAADARNGGLGDRRRMLVAGGGGGTEGIEEEESGAH